MQRIQRCLTKSVMLKRPLQGSSNKESMKNRGTVAIWGSSPEPSKILSRLSLTE
ncbi:hypothetical protein SERMPB_00036 (plasmid) [Serratia marcescens]